MKTLNEKQSLFLLISTILNQSQKASVTLNNTVELFRRVDFEKRGELTLELIYEGISEKPALHRFPRRMASYIMESMEILENNFSGKASLVFDINSKGRDVVDRLLEFKGIGIHKAEVASTILRVYSSNNTDKEILSLVSQRCPALEDTIWDELRIIDEIC